MTERIRTKSELKRLFTNLKRKEITDDMISILIDVLWRDKANLRTSGFDKPGGTDAVISFDEGSRTFTILPLDPLVDGWIPRFGIYTWNQRAVYQRMYETYNVEIPDEEGLYIFYFAANAETRIQELVYVKNPTIEQLEKIYTDQVFISAVYWDATAKTALHFGNDRHGSEWNPQMHLYLHDAFGARRKSGLTFAGYIINGDGSLSTHAQFNIVGGIMFHDDIELTIPTSSNSLPILYKFGNYPRYLANSGYAFYKGASRVCFNTGMISVAEADSGNFVLYHIFATNEYVTESRKVISVMGTAQYTNLADAYRSVEPELDGIFTYMPQQGRCYLGSVIIQTSDDYTNSEKARIVALTGNESHPPVTIDEASQDILSIDEKQVLSIALPTPADGIVSGGIVTWLYGLTFAVSQTIYWLGGKLYVAPSTIVTLNDADATNPRIDVFSVNNSSAVEVIEGIPAAEPAKPSINPATNIELTFVLIPALATEPPSVTDELIYNENVEWTGTVNGVTAYFDSTVNPQTGSVCINVNSIGNNDTITFTDTLPNNFSDFENLSLWMRLKATPAKGHKLFVRFLLAGADVSNEIEILFDSTNITTWQNIAVALSAFTFTGETFDAVRFRWSKTGALVDFTGFYLDYIKLQRGITPPPVATDTFTTAFIFNETTRELSLIQNNNRPVLTVTIPGGGEDGADGRGIVSVILTSTAGLVDTYTITYTDATTSTFDVTNGADGADGAPGTPGTDGADGITPHIGLNGNWYIGETDTTIPATGPTGPSGADGAPGTDGTDGQDAYLYVAYASTNTGTGWSLTPTDLLKYRAEIQSTTPLTPVAGDFSAATWVKYIGDDGADGTGGGGTTTVVTEGEDIEIYIDFVDDIAYTYTCPFDLRFLELEYENNAPALSVALNTDMAKYDDLVVTPDGPGLVIIKGKVATAFVWDVYIDFEIAEAQTYKCPYAIQFTSMEHEQANAPTVDPAIGTSLAKYDVVTITPDAVGLVTLLGIKL